MPKRTGKQRAIVDDDDDDDYQWAIANFHKLPVPIPTRVKSGFKGVSRAGHRWFARATDPKTGGPIRLASIVYSDDPSVRCYPTVLTTLLPSYLLTCC